jgi:hypothetical protein
LISLKKILFFILKNKFFNLVSHKNLIKNYNLI